MQIPAEHRVPASPADWQVLHRTHVQALQQRYEQVLRHFPQVDSVVLLSGHAHLKNSLDDQHWPVIPTPHFAHWTPFVCSPALLVIRPSQKPRLLVERHTSYWDSPGAVSEAWDQSSFDIEVVDSLSGERVYGVSCYIGDDDSLRPARVVDPETSRLVRESLDLIRTEKSAYEVASIRQANVIAARGHRALRALFSSGVAVNELDLQLEYLKVTRQTDFTVPYGNIVGLGTHAAVLHHVHYEDRARDDRELSLLVDAGATCNGYASDITRTWSRGHGPAAQRFARLIDAVQAVQQQLCSAVVVEQAYESLHNRAHELLADVLIALEIAKGDAHGLVDRGVTRHFFPHGLGHSLGLQVHDVGMKTKPSAKENPYLRNTSKVRSGQVVTIEPGIYFIPALLSALADSEHRSLLNWRVIEELTPFGGVRIEDNVLATADGPVNLTCDLLVETVS